MRLTRTLLKTVPGKEISRREMLARAGKIAAGAAGISIISSRGMNLTSRAEAKPATFPWGFKKIDPARAGKIAYENYYKNYCCYGVSSAILIPLQEDIGEPYTLFPVEATIWGHGGTVGWGTICGALNGAGIATGLVAGKKGEDILNDVIAWYTKTKLPIYKPSNPRVDIKTVSESNSALCHISVGKWMRKEGVNFFTPQLRERCGRLTADVAMKTVELLNDWVDGKYRPTHGSQVKMQQMPSENECKYCHENEIPELPANKS